MAVPPDIAEPTRTCHALGHGGADPDMAVPSDMAVPRPPERAGHVNGRQGAGRPGGELPGQRRWAYRSWVLTCFTRCEACVSHLAYAKGKPDACTAWALAHSGWVAQPGSPAWCWCSAVRNASAA